MPTVLFEPAGVTAEVREGTSVLEAAQDMGLNIGTACGGKASCRECRVKIVSGDAGLSAVNFAEERVLGNTYFITQERLSCQCRVMADGAVVEIPEPRKRLKKKPRRYTPRPRGRGKA